MEHDPEKQRPARQTDVWTPDVQAPPSLLPSIMRRLGLEDEQSFPQRSIQAVQIALQQSDWQIRIRAVRELEALGKQAPLELLAMALHDQDRSVRAATARALGLREEKAARVLLQNALRDPDWHVREIATLHIKTRKWGIHMKKPIHQASALDDQLYPQPGTFVPTQPPRGISRRAVLSSIAGLAAVGIAGAGITLLANRQTPSGSPASSPDHRTTPASKPRTTPTPASRTTPTAEPSPTPEPSPTATPNSVVTGGKVLTYSGHTAAVNAIAWNPRNKLLVASGSDDKTVQVWSPNTGAHFYTYDGHTDKVDTVSWSPDGLSIASGGGGIAANGGTQDHSIHVWNITNGQVRLRYTGHTDYIAAARWSPDGKYIATASYDKTVQVWDALTGKTLVTYTGHSSEVLSVCWSPDGKQIASCGSFADRTVQIWDPMTGGTILTYHGHANNGLVLWVDWSPDGKMIASSAGGQQSDAIVKIWDAATGRTIFTYTGHIASGVSGSLPPGNAFAARAGSAGRTLFGAMLPQTHLGGSGVGVFRVAWSPDGMNLISAGGSPDFVIKLWNLQTGNTLYTFSGHTSFVVGLSWAPYATRFASASSDGTAQVWQIE